MLYSSTENSLKPLPRTSDVPHTGMPMTNSNTYEPYVQTKISSKMLPRISETTSIPLSYTNMHIASTSTYKPKISYSPTENLSNTLQRTAETVHVTMSSDMLIESTSTYTPISSIELPDKADISFTAPVASSFQYLSMTTTPVSTHTPCKSSCASVTSVKETSGDNTSQNSGILTMIPLWLWSVLIIVVLTLFSLCGILCTLFIYVKQRRSVQKRNREILKRRKESGTTLVNGVDEEEEAAVSIEDDPNATSLQPIKDTVERPVSRWDSLRMSWSRRSSRRGVSTFKPHLYRQQQENENATSGNYYYSQQLSAQEQLHFQSTSLGNPAYTMPFMEASAINSAKVISNPSFEMNGEYFGSKQSEMEPNQSHYYHISSSRKLTGVQ